MDWKSISQLAASLNWPPFSQGCTGMSDLRKWIEACDYGTAWKGAKAFLMQRFGVHPRPETLSKRNALILKNDEARNV